MIQLPSLRMAATLGGLRKSASALVILASPSRWWLGLLLRSSQTHCLRHLRQRRQVAFDAVPLDPKLSSSSGVKLCTYQQWFARPAGFHCLNYWDVPMGTAKLQRIFRYRMGSHMLPIEQGRHLQLPRHRRVCKLCRTGALGDERHLLLECPALADVRTEFSQLIARCSGIMARLVWFKDQQLVSRYIIACLDMVPGH